MPACACCAVPQPSGTGSAGSAQPSSGPVAAFAGSARAGCGAPHRGSRPAPGWEEARSCAFPALPCLPGGKEEVGLWLGVSSSGEHQQVQMAKLFQPAQLA